MESCIKQNNAIEIYEVIILESNLVQGLLWSKDLIVKENFIEISCKDYFNERDEATDCEEPRSKTVNLFR